MAPHEKVWHKSSYSDATGTGDCVEVASDSGSVAVRDSKSPVGTLDFGAPAWRALVAKLS